jgi:TolB-like protein/DNA-binding winged helix-turn-helix (wHTH) protein/Flp pilus assembly protein TadD
MSEPLPAYEFGAFRIDRANKRLTRGTEVVALSPKLFDTLLLLVENAPQLVEKETFLRRLWPKTVVEESALAENISRLRRALGESEAQRYIETQPKRGYRFIAAVSAPVSALAPEPIMVPDSLPMPGPAVSQSAIPASVLPTRPHRRRWLALGAAALLLAVAAGYRLLVPDDGGAPIRSIAVLPFASLSADPEQEYFTDGVTDELITELAQLHSLRVISRSSVMRYKGTRKSVPEIARELNVDAIVEGTVSRSADHLRVSAQVIRAEPEEHLWAQHYERAPGDLVALQTQLAREIAAGIRVQFSAAERATLGAPHTVDPVAHEAFLKGRFYWARRSEANTRRSIEYFQSAIDADPDYAQAYVGLADSFVTLTMPEAMQEVLPHAVAYPQARAALQRALELDPNSGEAYATLAHIYFQYDRDWPRGEATFRRAIQLSPNYANAHQWLAMQIFWIGRTDEALREIRAARQLDPLSLAINANECLVLGGARQFDAAIAQCRRTLELDPDFAIAHFRLGQVFMLKGDHHEAVPELRRAAQLSGDCPRAVSELALALALVGDKAQAAQLLASLQAAASRRFVGKFDLALIHAALGEDELALAGLEQAFDEHSPSLTLLDWSPAFARLRSHPRFVTLTRRVGLPVRVARQ